VENPDLISAMADAFGSQAVVAAVDARKVGEGRWEIFTYGGRKATGLDARDYAARAVEKGAGEILLTSMDRDGAKSGYDLELVHAVSTAAPVPVIASGGAGGAADMVAAVKAGADAVLAASIFHFGLVSIAEVKASLAAAGEPVRPVWEAAA
jgi:cyclase